jgi:hypothetical protein
MKEQLGTGKPQRCREQPEQKSRGESDQQQHFAPRLPVLKSQGFDLEFGFLKTEAFLNLEAPNIGEGHLQACSAVSTGSQVAQIPGPASFALSHHD